MLIVGQMRRVVFRFCPSPEDKRVQATRESGTWLDRGRAGL